MLTLLALRPCLIATGVALDNARCNGPALHDIAQYEEVHHAVHSRPLRWLGMVSMAAGSAQLAALSTRLPRAFAELVSPAPIGLDRAVAEVLGSRAPPF